MEVENIINNLKDGNNVEASKAFNDVMSDKLRTALDAKKIELASTLIQRKTADGEEQE